MTATTAKLRELLKAAGRGPWRVTRCAGIDSWGVADADGYEVSWHEMHKPNAQLAAAAPALARLVVDLSEALEHRREQGVLPQEADYIDSYRQKQLDEVDRSTDAALADVEKLDLTP